MKNNLKFGIMIAVLAVLSIAVSNAQCLQYTPGTQSAYAMNATGDSLITMQVTLTSGGAATVTRSIIAYSGTEPTPTTFILGPGRDWITTSAMGDPMELELKSSLSGESYYLIGFDNPNDYRAFGTGGDKVIISCECKAGSGICSVSYTTSNNTTCVSCVAEENCSKCEQKQTKEGTATLSGSSLLIRATSITIQ